MKQYELSNIKTKKLGYSIINDQKLVSERNKLTKTSPRIDVNSFYT